MSNQNMSFHPCPIGSISGISLSHEKRAPRRLSMKLLVVVLPSSRFAVLDPEIKVRT